ncbi:MAG: prephenate dehydrogenase/arogenate dehydrogenase family protein [Thaumarchaeota archaeon]|nr:prephenate dehydrogenase/arogenate dehydrogenase family protein [Nitrososphaerota archaeon]
MNVGVVGAGRMGRWFARHFKRLGHSVTLYDVNRERAESVSREIGCASSESLEGLEADAYLVAVPIERTLDVVRELSSKGAGGIVEIASLKSEIHKGLVPLARSGVKVASIHPLFGEGAKDLREERVALVPILDWREELDFVKGLMGEANYEVVSAEEHDEAMAVVLGLTHLLNMLFSSLTVEKEEELKKFSSRMFLAQLTLSKAMMLEDPELFVRLQLDNPKFLDVMDRLERELRDVREFVEKKDHEGYKRKFERMRERVKGKEGAYRLIYGLKLGSEP